MSRAYASIMKGLEEIKEHNEGKIQLKTSTIEIKPPPVCNDTKDTSILDRGKIMISS